MFRPPPTEKNSPLSPCRQSPSPPPNVLGASGPSFLEASSPVSSSAPVSTGDSHHSAAGSWHGAAGGGLAGFSSVFPAVLCGVFAVLVFVLVVQMGRARLARDLAQREADERVAAARARRVERMLREGEERRDAAAEADVEMGVQQPPPTLVVSPGGAVWVAKAEKQFDDCFLTDDDGENDGEAEKEKEKGKRKKQNASPTDDTCCEKGKSETTGSDGASRR